MCIFVYLCVYVFIRPVKIWDPENINQNHKLKNVLGDFPHKYYLQLTLAFSKMAMI